MAYSTLQVKVRARMGVRNKTNRGRADYTGQRLYWTKPAKMVCVVAVGANLGGNTEEVIRTNRIPSRSVFKRHRSRIFNYDDSRLSKRRTAP